MVPAAGHPIFLLRPWRSDTKGMEPVVGLEPTTDGLQNRCSTTELNWRRYLNHQPRLKVPTVREVPDSICALVFGSFVARKRAVLFSTERDTFCEGPTRWQVKSPPLCMTIRGKCI